MLYLTPFSPILRVGNMRSKGKKPPNCEILDIWVFDKYILADEPFANALPILET